MFSSINLSFEAGLVQAFVCEVNLLKVCLFVSHRQITYGIEDITDTHTAIYQQYLESQSLYQHCQVLLRYLIMINYRSHQDLAEIFLCFFFNSKCLLISDMFGFFLISGDCSACLC